MKLSHKKPYKHLTQKGDFCSATCIQMIFFKYDIRIEQEELAYDLGVIIKPKDRSRFSLSFLDTEESGKNPGLRIYRFGDIDIQRYLSIHGFSTSPIPYASMTLKQFEAHLIHSIENGIDCMIAFYRGPLDPAKTRGHYVLLSEYDTNSQTLTVCDPTPKTPNFRSISLNQMYECMSPKRDRERGLVLVSRI